MKRKIFLCSIVALLFPFCLFAAPNTTDLGIKSDDIQFSKDINNVIKGEKIRIYASVYNQGESDGYARAIIYENVKQISDAEVSVKAKGVEDDVYTDMMVPDQDFRIYIELKAVFPEDVNPNNNQALSVFVHVQDDLDKDGLGDDVDTDDDNDGVSDEEEQRLGTDKNRADTDNDGVSDGQDAFPLDPKKTTKEVPKPIEKPKETLQPKETLSEKETIASQTKEKEGEMVKTEKEVDAVKKEEEKTATDLTDVYYQSPQIELLQSVKIIAQPVNWNTYYFNFSSNVTNLSNNNLEYLWIFGDGKESNKNGNHTFSRAGEQLITLKVKGPMQNYIYDNIKIKITFWSIYNYWLWLIVLAAIVGLVLIGSSFRRRENRSLGIKREVKKPKEFE